MSCSSNELKSYLHIATPIKTIYEYPTSVGSDSIYITGKVTESYPAKGLSGYIVEADGYIIWVWSKYETAPCIGSTLKIKGVVKNMGGSYCFFDKTFH